IELDLLRTLPNNCHYENLDSDGIPKLRRVLLAYSRHDPVVGYCQGLNRLAAIALLFMDEEDAFWCLVAIIKFIMPDGYYTRTLITSHVDQKVLKDIMIDKLPRLHAHFEQNNVDLSLFTFNWFLTIFVDNVPVEIYLRIWDVFLYEGSKVCHINLLELFLFVAYNGFWSN
ncbi:UNVERIFIED_CONTAM: tbc1d2b, partial [Trichonephila clavipes]